MIVVECFHSGAGTRFTQPFESKKEAVTFASTVVLINRDATRAVLWDYEKGEVIGYVGL